MNKTQDLLECLLASIKTECISDADAKEIQFKIEQALLIGNRNHVMQHCREAAERVSKWPAWKRNILVDSAKPTLDKPRQPIVND